METEKVKCHPQQAISLSLEFFDVSPNTWLPWLPWHIWFLLYLSLGRDNSLSSFESKALLMSYDKEGVTDSCCLPASPLLLIYKQNFFVLSKETRHSRLTHNLTETRDAHITSVSWLPFSSWLTWRCIWKCITLDYSISCFLHLTLIVQSIRLVIAGFLVVS
jgi:hypothetical protein